MKTYFIKYETVDGLFVSINRSGVLSYGKGKDICTAWIMMMNGLIYIVKCGTDYLDGDFINANS